MDSSVAKDYLSLKKDALVDKLVDNLPSLRAKIKMSQSELADMMRIGRQTIISIENKSSKMRWDTFLALIVTLSQNEAAAEYLRMLNLDMKTIDEIVGEEMSNRTGGGTSLQDKLWTDNNYNGDKTIRGIVPVPVGYVNGKCPKCGSKNIRGAIIMPTADEQDPNLMCLDCGYWWD